MAEIDDSEPAEHSHTPPGWPIKVVEFKPSGKAPKKYGDDVYRFGAALTLSAILPRRGWTLVKKSKDYAYFKPPPGEAGPPFRISIAVPTQAECVALAERSYARGESWMGQLGEWPAWYHHERNRDTRRLWRNRATGEMESELLPSPPESSLHIGEWGIWEAKATGQAGRFAYGMFAPGTIPNLASSEPAERLSEGAATPVELTRYERSPEARRLCLAHYGAQCQACDLKYEEKYGAIGAALIHVHHVTPLSTIGEAYEVNPIRDLVPLCATCHHVVHRRDPPFTVAELRRAIAEQAGRD